MARYQNGLSDLEDPDVIQTYQILKLRTWFTVKMRKTQLSDPGSGADTALALLLLYVFCCITFLTALSLAHYSWLAESLFERFSSSGSDDEDDESRYSVEIKGYT